MNERTQWERLLPVKVTAVLLAIALLSTVLFTGGAVVLVTVLAGEEHTAATVQEALGNELAYYYADRLAANYITNAEPAMLAESLKEENYWFTVTDDSEGVVLCGNYNGQATLGSCEVVRRVEKWDKPTSAAQTQFLLFTVYLKPTLPRDDVIAGALRWGYTLFTHRVALTVVCLVCGLLGLVAVIYLCCVVGRRAGEDAPRCNHADRLPLELFLGGLTALGWILVAVAWSVLKTTLWGIAVCVALVPMAIALLLWLTLTVAARLKTGTLWRNTLVYRVLHLIWRVLCACGRVLRAGIAALPLLWKTALCIVALVVIDLLVFASAWYEIDNILIWWLIKTPLLIGVLAWFMWGLRRLQSASRALAAGNLTHQLPTRGLIGELKTTADDLNRIGEGMQRAVDARLKSERLRTELITNVSHDIKTPLTSIVSYVDLLKKEEPENEQMRDYIAVLERQAERMKKLIEDLVEASKATTGNLTVEPVRCELNTLLSQVVGEYDERLAQAALTPVIHVPEMPVTVLADSRHLWRIFDNLMSNICKYALSGTRVYLDLMCDNGQAKLVFRNISRCELHVAAEELTERFVRGDSARSTEGSGLGLSIAEGLTALQKGHMTVSVDGDLFKVILELPLAPPQNTGGENEANRRV